MSEQPPGSFTLEIGKPSSQSCVSMPVELVDKYEDKDEDVDADQTRTERPVGGQQFTQLEEIDIDFRVPGLSHAVVKGAEIFRVQDLVKKIESHPHREAFLADLQQNNVYNPFSNNSKEMVRELCNVELFELCETIPKVQCSQCLLCWNQGMIYCTCGQFLVERESRRKCNKLRLDALSDTAKELTLKVNISKVFTIALSETKSIVNHNSQEQKCIEMDELAKQNHTYHLSTEEFKRYQGQWYLTLNKSGKNVPMRLRPDFRAAVSLKNRLHRESGEEIAEPISPQQYRR